MSVLNGTHTVCSIYFMYNYLIYVFFLETGFLESLNFDINCLDLTAVLAVADTAALLNFIALLISGACKKIISLLIRNKASYVTCYL